MVICSDPKSSEQLPIWAAIRYRGLVIPGKRPPFSQDPRSWTEDFGLHFAGCSGWEHAVLRNGGQLSYHQGLAFGGGEQVGRDGGRAVRCLSGGLVRARLINKSGSLMSSGAGRWYEGECSGSVP